MPLAEACAEIVEPTIHSGEIAGLTVPEATRADANSYIAGTIDSNELVDRVRAKYGLA
ncbi:antitoxin VbhA family protein [Arthrobacter terrae]|uniref:antitoxin VbhA family protein n=1 Tax=Arthrobacter terrae TaxID=2935737 RepID=UPI0028AA7255|nr:hypothetical protein [Arthrobacter terrae]